MHRSSRELSQVAIRLVKEPPLYSNEPVNTPQDAIRVLADVFSDYDREVVIVVNLRPDLKPICMNIASMGTLD